jgi:hypothetical protein
MINTEDSSKWVGFDEALKVAVAAANARIIRGPVTGKFVHGGSETWTATEYLIPDGKFNLKDFPVYGQRRMESCRVHMSINGRFIEPMSLFKMLDIADHPSHNGRITIVNFTSADDKYENMPTPATTKVAFAGTCPIFLDFKRQCVKFLQSKPQDEPANAEKHIDLTLQNIPKMKLDDLKYWCGQKNLSKSGIKGELVARLTNLITPVHVETAEEKTKRLAKEDAAKKAATIEAKRLAAIAAAKKAADDEAKRLAAVAAAKKAAEDEAKRVAAIAAAKKAAEDEAKRLAAAAAAESLRISKANITTVDKDGSITIHVDGAAAFTVPCYVDSSFLLPIFKQYIDKHGNAKFLEWIPKFNEANRVFE